MNAAELWSKSGLAGPYEAWSFGDDADGLAELVRMGIKTATSSAYDVYEDESEPIPQVGEYSVILDSRSEAVCIIRTTKVYVTAFDQVTAEHAYKEGEGDRSLAHWREVHQAFFTQELAMIHRRFDEGIRVVCEEFEVVYP